LAFEQPEHCGTGKVHFRNTVEQLKLVGPRSMGVSLLTAGFVGMVFTIQVRLPLFMLTA
jgi:ABC-type transporter Mla maintaining outer membrane lipid asymmetry permease subunit MlaE